MTMRRPLAPKVAQSAAYRKLLSWLEQALRKPRLRHGAPRYARGCQMYWDLGQRICQFGVVPGLFSSLERDLRRRLPRRTWLGGTELRLSCRLYQAYAAQPRLAELARDLALRSHRILLDGCDDLTGREFYIRLARSLRLRVTDLSALLRDGLFEQIQAAYGRRSGWLDRVLGTPGAPPPTGEQRIVQLLTDHPTMGYADVARRTGLGLSYVSVIAKRHGLERRGDFGDLHYRKSAAVAAAKLGIPLEEYLARRAAGLRWCTRCYGWLPRAQFERPRTGAPDGSYCIVCLKEYMAGLLHRRHLEQGETPVWIQYREWWHTIYDGLSELPPEWQQAFLECKRPNLTTMAAALGVLWSTFRLRWLRRGLPTPPRHSSRLRWELEPAMLLGEHPATAG